MTAPTMTTPMLSVPAIWDVSLTDRQRALLGVMADNFPVDAFPDLHAQIDMITTVDQKSDLVLVEAGVLSADPELAWQVVLTGIDQQPRVIWVSAELIVQSTAPGQALVLARRLPRSTSGNPFGALIELISPNGNYTLHIDASQIVDELNPETVHPLTTGLAA